MNTRLRRTLAGAFIAAMSAINTAEPATLNILDNTQQSEIQPEFIDNHVIFLLDFSSSMRDGDYDLMVKSIKQALQAPNTEIYLNSGNHYKITMVGFAAHGRMLDAQIVNSPEAANAFIEEFFDTVDATQLYNSTHMLPGLNATLEEIQHPENSLVGKTNIIIIGDEAPSDVANSLKKISLLHALPNTRVHCLGLYDRKNSTQNMMFYYLNDLPSPAQNYADHGNFKEKGYCRIIRHPDDLQGLSEEEKERKNIQMAIPVISEAFELPLN